MHQKVENDARLGIVEDHRKGTVQMLKSGISQACDSAQADDGEQEEGIVNGELLENPGSDIGPSDVCDYGEAE